MPCAVNVGRRRYAGVVLNLSQGGLFVQTNADAPRGAAVGIDLNTPEHPQAIPLRAQVVWRRIVPPALRTAAHGGMGVRILQADESYYQLLSAWLRAAPEIRPEEQARLTYRVRVRDDQGPRSRCLAIEASSPDEACNEALRWAGGGWRVLDIEAL